VIYDEAAMALLNDICERLGIDPNYVRSIEIAPRAITVELFARNEEGAKYIGTDGKVALETRMLPFNYTAPASKQLHVGGSLAPEGESL
jgi:hypothetical protein